MVIIPFSVALLIGGYAHFLSSGTDNVFRMPPGDWRFPFQVSAEMLASFGGTGLLGQISDVWVHKKRCKKVTPL